MAIVPRLKNPELKDSDIKSTNWSLLSSHPLSSPLPRAVVLINTFLNSFLFCGQAEWGNKMLIESATASQG